MLEASFDFDDIEITNILREDLPSIARKAEEDGHFSIARLDERFLESYLSECEYFLKILKGGSLIGLVKGRVEFKNPHEAWIWFYYIEERFDGSGLAAEIARQLLEYMKEEYLVKDFYIRVPMDDLKAIKFWKGMGFKTLRAVKDFYFIDGQNIDMLILENKNVKSGAKRKIL
jgi:ribosomal protein S18 acetylase RimI-like enzyme